METKRLSDDQIETFNVEYVDDHLWMVVSQHITKRFGQDPFLFADVGGGNGRFADRLLESFPNAMAYVIDNSQHILDANTSHPRKQVVLGSAIDLTRVLPKKVDLVAYNWVLHHLVGDCHRDSTRFVDLALSNARNVLNVNGCLSVFENNYQGVVIDTLPSYMIFWVTSLKRIARYVRQFGANTASVGVCFRSKREWIRRFEHAKYRVESTYSHVNWAIPVHWRLLGVRGVHVGHYWMRV